MKNRTLSILSVTAVIIAGAGIMLLLTSNRAEPALMEEPDPSRLVRTEVLTPSVQTQWIDADGFLISPRQLKIFSPLAGKVTYALQGLKGGTYVQEGDLLMKLDDRRARLAYDSALTEMIHLSTQFITLAGMDHASRNEWEAYLSDLTSSDPDKLPRLPAGDIRQEQLAVTKGVTAASYRLASAAMDLADHNITALFSGVLDGSGVTEGSWVSPGVPLAELWEINPLELTLSLGLSEIEQVKIGSEVLVTGPDEKMIKGQVVRKEPFLQSRSQSAQIHVNLNFKPGKEWPAGSFVQARIKGLEWERAYALPREALINGKLPLYEEGRLVLKDITILGKEGNMIIFHADLDRVAEYVTTVLPSPMEGMQLKKEDF